MSRLLALLLSGCYPLSVCYLGQTGWARGSENSAQGVADDALQEQLAASDTLLGGEPCKARFYAVCKKRLRLRRMLADEHREIRYPLQYFILY